MTRAGRGQPMRPRTPTVPQPGSGNYFAGVLDELRKVVWPTWDELGRMTGVVVTTVVLMALLVSAADYGLGIVVRQLYTTSTTTSVPGSKVSAQPTVKASPRATSRTTLSPAAASTPATAPVTP